MASCHCLNLTPYALIRSLKVGLASYLTLSCLLSSSSRLITFSREENVVTSSGSQPTLLPRIRKQAVSSYTHRQMDTHTTQTHTHTHAHTVRAHTHTHTHTHTHARAHTHTPTDGGAHSKKAHNAPYATATIVSHTDHKWQGVSFWVAGGSVESST